MQTEAAGVLISGQQVYSTFSKIASHFPAVLGITPYLSNLPILEGSIDYSG